MAASKYGKVLQVLPAAPGWEAVYALERGEYGTDPLQCWALLEKQADDPGGNVQLVGMIAGGEGLEVVRAPHFLGYTYPGCQVDWAQLAWQYHEQHA